MRGFNLKALLLMLLIVLLPFSNFDTCSARRGRHWRSGRDGNSSSVKKKNNGKKSNNHHHHHHHRHHHSGSADSSSSSSSGKEHKPSPAPSPYLSPCPTPSPSPKPEPKPQPSPSPSPRTKHKPKPCPSPSPSRKHKPKPGPSTKRKHKPRLKPSPSPSPRTKHKPMPCPSPSPSRKHKPKPGPSTKRKHKPRLKPSPSPCPTPSPKPGRKPNPQPSPSHPSTPRDNFNVLDFGAEGDGKSDDTKAFQATWAAACKVKASTVVVPSDFKFLVGPISFNGAHCQNSIVLQLDGTIIAPTNRKAWGSGLLQWLEFTKLEGFTIQGSGTIDGQGAVWWGTSHSEHEISRSHAGKMPHTKPTAVRFYGSHDATVTGITIQNSPKCHLKFDNCNGVEVYNIIVSSPGSSPNTDGIHLQNSQNVAIHHNQLACGDDCVSIQTGCSNVNIHHVSCGPGHGFSIGGLGKHNTKACVSNVTVKNVALQGTMTGVRIKTWQGGSGSVQNVKFSNIEVSEVKTPIMINQYYCDKSSCKNQTKAIVLSGIYYENIKGTYTAKPVHLACSDSSPCTDVSLTNIELTPVKEKHHLYDPFCWQSYGQLRPPMVPPIHCLQTGKPPKHKAQIVPDSC